MQKPNHQFFLFPLEVQDEKPMGGKHYSPLSSSSWQHSPTLSSPFHFSFFCSGMVSPKECAWNQRDKLYHVSNTTHQERKRVGYRILLFCPSSVWRGTIYKLNRITPKYTHARYAIRNQKILSMRNECGLRLRMKPIYKSPAVIIILRNTKSAP